MQTNNNLVIRFANENDIPLVMKFIDENWKKGHILGNDESFFRYELIRNGKVAVVLAFEDSKLVGMEGFIPYGDEKRDIMTVVWKVVKSATPMLGMKILDYIRKKADVRTISSPGINLKTVELYHYLGYKTGKMTQWYRLNSKISNYKIAVVNNYTSSKVDATSYKLQKFTDFGSLSRKFSFDAYYNTNPIPLKEAWYIEHRYFHHPIYQYDVYGIIDDTDKICRTLLVFRSQEAQGSCCLRLVDVIGNTSLLYQVTAQIDELLQTGNYEYVDFYEKGLDVKAMGTAGWKPVIDSGNIIPNYFAPFVQENIDIRYFTSEPSIKLFKADGDQDRPN